VTETDTETLVQSIEESPGATLEERSSRLDHVEGTYGIAVVAEADPGRSWSPGAAPRASWGRGWGVPGASDASAVLGHTDPGLPQRRRRRSGDAGGYRDRQAASKSGPWTPIEWDLDAIALGGYPHFMLKEILRASETVQSTPGDACSRPRDDAPQRAETLDP